MSMFLLTMAAMSASGGGGDPDPEPTIIFQPTNALDEDDNNPNFSFRGVVTTSGTVGDEIRVTFKAANATALNIVGASVGIYDNYPGIMTSTPIPFLFSGNTTASVAAGAQITSDWLDVTSLGIGPGDELVIVLDTGANGGTRLSDGNTNIDTFFTSGASSHEADPEGASDSYGYSWGLVSVETQ